MKQKLLLPLLLMATLPAFYSCKKSGGKTGLLVPEDAAVVFHINNASLSSKLSWDEIKQSNWFREMSQQTTDSLAQQLLADPSLSGIDSKADFVIFIKKQGNNAYVVFEGSVKDAAAFEKFNKQIEKETQSGKDGDVSFLTMDDNAVLSWNSRHFTYVSGIRMPDMTEGFMGNRGYKADEDGAIFPTDSLKLYGKKVLNLKGSDNLDKDSRFADLVKDGSDMHLWMNTEKYYGDMFGPMLSMMGNLGALTKGNVSATSFNFDNGKITMRSKQYYGKEMADLVAKYPGKPVSAEVAGRLPSQNVVAAIAMNYPPDGLKAFIKLLGVEGLVNMAMSQTNYSVDEFIKANKGEILLSVSDLQSKKEDLPEGAPSTPDARILFATSVNDKAAFEKLIGLISEQVKNAPMSSPPDMTYKLDNNWFALGNSADQVNQFIAGSNTKAPYADKISGHPFGFYIDLNKILQAASTDISDSSGRAAMDVALSTWSEVTGWGGEYKNKATEFYAEITMTDKNSNSLKQLNNFIDKIATIYINKEKVRKQEMLQEVQPF